MKSSDSYETGLQQCNLLPKTIASPSSFLDKPSKLNAGLVPKLSSKRVPTFNEGTEGLDLKYHETLTNDKITNKNFKLKKRNVQLQSEHKVIKENRINYQIYGEDDINTGLYDSVTLFQRLLRGRAYQTMMIMAKIRYHPILHSNEEPVILDTAIKIKEITGADILEYARRKFISRFFDILSNESIHINNSQNKNNMLIQQGHFSRIESEMVERKRRQIEVTGRIEQEEILKQVLKIHEDVSVLLCKKIMEEAIQQSAKEESLKATMKSCKNKFYNVESDRNIEKELMSDFIIPEAHRVILKERQNLH